MVRHYINGFIYYALFSLLLASPYATVEAYTSPRTIEGVQALDAEELIDLAVSQPTTTIVDARTYADRIEGYIDGSTHLNDTETNCASLATIAPNHDAPIVFYCNGEHCDRSDKSAQIALSCNYTNIYWFRGGMTEWLAKGYPVAN